MCQQRFDEETYSRGNVRDGVVAQRQPYTERALVNTIDPKVLESCVRGNARGKRGEQSCLEEHRSRPIVRGESSQRTLLLLRTAILPRRELARRGL